MPLSQRTINGAVKGFHDGASAAPTADTPDDETDSSFSQGLTPTQIEALARKVYALLRDELRIEAERYGRVLVR